MTFYFYLVTIWNLTSVVVSFITLILTVNEKPNVPLRVLISVYSMHSVVRLLLEYKKRNPRVLISNVVVAAIFRSSTILESLDPVFTGIWNVIGCYTVNSSIDILLRDAPGLLWLTVVFLGPYPLSVAIYVLCLIKSVLLLIISFLFIKKGASDADISILPKYKFEVSNRIKNMKKNKKNDENRADRRACRMVPMPTNGTEFSAVRVLQIKDAQCCICLCNYENGVELYSLPCNHHFHTGCIRTWLKRKASCPLCNREMNR